MAGTYRSGRRPVPTALHLLRGTEVRNRKHEPRGKPGRPPMPADLADDAYASEAWTYYADLTEQLGILTLAHAEALRSLALAHAHERRINEDLAKMNHRSLIVEEHRDKLTGTVVRRRPRANPLLPLRAQASKDKRTWLGEFGLTPITSTKVAAVAPKRPKASRYITRVS